MPNIKNLLRIKANGGLKGSRYPMPKNKPGPLLINGRIFDIPIKSKSSSKQGTSYER